MDYCCCDMGVSVGSAERDERSELTSLVSLFLMLRLLIFGRTVSIITIISMVVMLNFSTMWEGFGSESVFSIMYLN